MASKTLERKMSSGNSFFTDAIVAGRRVTALVDSGCTHTCLSNRWVDEKRVTYRVKRKPMRVALANGEAPAYGRGVINLEAPNTEVVIAGIKDTRAISISDIGDLDMILGMDWLQTHNPQIDWAKRTISGREPARRIAGTRKTSTQSSPTTGRVGRISLHKIMRICAKRPEEVGIFWLRRVDTNKAKEPSEDSKRQIPEEYKEYAALFEENEATALAKHQQWDHEIPLEEGVKLKPGPMYPLTRDQADELKRYIEVNIRKGYIRQSESPMASPILFVPKKNGKMRLCVDYRQLNNATIKNRYPLPLITELMDRLQGVKWFTKFDIREGYYRIRMAEGHEWKTAFKTRYGLYEYLVMPFGLTNAPATFQAVINQALHEYLDVFVTAYLDDVLVYSSGTLEEHKEHVKKVLAKLQEYNLLIQPDKSEFHVTRTEYLGFIISREGVEMDPKKTEAVRDWPTPTSVKEVQSFLGFANFLRKFIRDYSKTTIALTEITKKEKGFRWDVEQEQAFTELKVKFTNAPVLRLFNPNLRIVIFTDASDFAIGACFYQIQEDGKRLPVGYHSRKLTPAELNYDIHDKELLAIVVAMEEWSVWLRGSRYKVTVYSDHKNLTSFTTTKKLNRRQVRWAEMLADIDFEIIHCKGTENGAADALSRRVDYVQEGKPTYDAVLKTNDRGYMEYNHPRLATITIVEDEWEERIRNKKQGQIEYHEGRTVVPESIQQELIREKHGAIAHGHQGIEKTLERITRNYYFPNMRKRVEEVIKECIGCNLNKPTRHRPYGLLQPLEPPEGPWQSVSMDFIVKLPESIEPGTRRRCDSILVIVCRLTKYAYFLPTRENINAEELAYEIMRSVVSRHGMPKQFISDRDKLFTSKFWNTLLAKLGSKSKLSTSFHPQTDGQTERTNQTLEQYLRMYVNYEQSNWVDLLPTAQFAFNSAKSSTTGESPFHANHGYEPTAYGEPRKIESLSESARERADKYVQTYERLRKAISDRNKSAQQYANKRRVEGPTLKEGDKVFLLRGKNIKTKRPSGKLDNVKIGPFQVKRVVGPVNYELLLPTSMRIHPIFHISRLEPAPQNAEITKDIQLEVDETDYEVERIKDLRRFGRQWKYLVKWQGYEDTHNTWEPLKNLRGCQEAVSLYHQRHPEKVPRLKENQEPTNRPCRAQGLRTLRLRALHAQSAPPLPTSPTLQSRKARDGTSPLCAPQENEAGLRDAPRDSGTLSAEQRSRRVDDAQRSAADEALLRHDPPSPSPFRSPPDYTWNSDEGTQDNDQMLEKPCKPEGALQSDSSSKESTCCERREQHDRPGDNGELWRVQPWAWRKGRSRGMYESVHSGGGTGLYTPRYQTRRRGRADVSQCSHGDCRTAWKNVVQALSSFCPMEDLRNTGPLCLRDESKEEEANVTSTARTEVIKRSAEGRRSADDRRDDSLSDRNA